MAGKLFDGTVFEPVAGIGGVIAMLGTTGGELVSGSDSPFFEVTYLDSIIGLGQHSTVLIWSQSTTPPSGYGNSPGTGTLPSGVASGSITSGGVSSKSTPPVFQMRQGEMLQFRWVTRVVAALTGAAIDDLDVQFFVPQGVARWQVQSDNGRHSQMFQFPMPSDTTSSPAQGNNMTQQGAAALINPWLQAPWTETFVYGTDNQPAWQIYNNAGSTLSVGAIGINVWGYRYNLRNMKRDEGGEPWIPRVLFGKQIMTPRQWTGVIVPTASQS